MADFDEVAGSAEHDETPVPVIIYRKDGDPYLSPDGSTPATINVTGTDSKKYTLMQNTIQRRMLNNRRAKLEPSDIKKNRIDQAASAVHSWDGWTKGGEPMPCTDENIRAMLAHQHVLEQVEAGISTHADFFKNSAS